MEVIYFTFKKGHILYGTYVTVMAHDEERCIEIMNYTFGKSWSQYHKTTPYKNYIYESIRITEFSEGVTCTTFTSKVVSTVKSMYGKKKAIGK